MRISGGSAETWMRRGWQALLGAAATAATLAVVIGCDNLPSSGSYGATPAPVPTQLQAGERVFVQYCNVCHPGGHRGTGHNLIGIPDPDSEIAATVRNGRGAMPAFGPDKIPDSDLQSLIGYIRTLK